MDWATVAAWRSRRQGRQYGMEAGRHGRWLDLARLPHTRRAARPKRTSRLTKPTIRQPPCIFLRFLRPEGRLKHALPQLNIEGESGNTRPPTNCSVIPGGVRSAKAPPGLPHGICPLAQAVDTAVTPSGALPVIASPVPSQWVPLALPLKPSFTKCHRPAGLFETVPPRDLDSLSSSFTHSLARGGFSNVPAAGKRQPRNCS